MNKKLILIVGVIVIILILIILNNTKENDISPTEIEQSITTNNDSAGVEELAVTDESRLAGAYETYSPEKITQAGDKDVLLFFHATWCPSCRTLDSDLEKNKNNIPENTLILKVDYDKEGELRKKYGVTTQHTLVQVDTNGEMIKKWSGGSTLESIISQI